MLSPRADAGAVADAVRRLLRDADRRAAAVALGERVRAEVASGALLAELEGVARAGG